MSDTFKSEELKISLEKAKKFLKIEECTQLIKSIVSKKYGSFAKSDESAGTKLWDQKNNIDDMVSKQIDVNDSNSAKSDIVDFTKETLAHTPTGKVTFDNVSKIKKSPYDDM